MKLLATGLGTAALLSLLLLSESLSAPLPPPKARRTTLQEDQNNLIQKRGELWLTARARMTVDGKKTDAQLALVFSKGIDTGSYPNSTYKKFLQKSKVNGRLEVGIVTEKEARWTFTCYRLEERDGRRALVVPDLDGNEVVYRYEWKGTALKIKGWAGKEPPDAGFFPMGREYKRSK